MPEAVGLHVLPTMNTARPGRESDQTSGSGFEAVVIAQALPEDAGTALQRAALCNETPEVGLHCDPEALAKDTPPEETAEVLSTEADAPKGVWAESLPPSGPMILADHGPIPPAVAPAIAIAIAIGIAAANDAHPPSETVSLAPETVSSHNHFAPPNTFTELDEPPSAPRSAAAPHAASGLDEGKDVGPAVWQDTAATLGQAAPLLSQWPIVPEHGQRFGNDLASPLPRAAEPREANGFTRPDRLGDISIDAAVAARPATPPLPEPGSQVGFTEDRSQSTAEKDLPTFRLAQSADIPSNSAPNPTSDSSAVAFMDAEPASASDMAPEVTVHIGREAAQARPTPLTVAAPPPATPEPRAVIQQVTQHLGATDQDRIEITLTPEELGKVRLVITPGDVPVITIHADSRDTLDLMRRHSEVLARELRDTGFSGASLSFAEGNDRPDRQRRFEHSSAQKGGHALPEGGGAPPVPAASRPDWGRRIDIRI